jgi:hypothetical protein
MSTIDLILDALMADIPPNVQQDMGEEIWDSYHHFQSVLMERLSGHPDAQSMIDRYREQPDVYGDVLAEALVEADVEDDTALIEAATEVQALVAPLDSDTDADDVMNVPGTFGAGDVSTDHV